MTSEAGEQQPRVRDAQGSVTFEPHHCFACGELNEHGLHLQLHANPDLAWIETTLEDRFQGWERVAHGGIVCTLLDEVMAWSVIGRGTWAVTARLSVAFRKPVRTGRPLRAEGRVVNLGSRAARTEGRVVDAATREILATAEGTFVAIPPNEVRRLEERYATRRDASAGTTEVGDGDISERLAARPLVAAVP